KPQRQSPGFPHSCVCGIIVLASESWRGLHCSCGRVLPESSLCAASGGIFLLRWGGKGGRPMCFPWALARLLPSAVADKIAFHVGEASKDGEHQAPVLIPAHEHKRLIAST